MQKQQNKMAYQTVLRYNREEAMLPAVYPVRDALKDFPELKVARLPLNEVMLGEKSTVAGGYHLLSGRACF